MSERLTVPNRKLQSPPPGSLRLREYARRRTKAGFPISHQGIGKAIESGRIAEAVWRDEKGRPWINPTRADELLGENTDPSAQREQKAGGRPPEEEQEILFAEGGPEAEHVQTSGKDPKDSPGVAYNRARAVREAYDAQYARLKFQRETGELVRADVVRARCENVGVLLRDALRQIPARISGELAAESDAHKVEELLIHEIDRALEGLAELARPVG